MAAALAKTQDNSLTRSLQTPEQVLEQAKKLFGSLLGKIISPITPEIYKNYFILYAKACCSSPRSNDTTNELFKKCMEGMRKLVPEENAKALKKISEVGWAAIQYIVDMSGVEKADSYVPSDKVLIAYKAARVQRMLSTLLAAKEWMIGHHYNMTVSDRFDEAMKKREWFFSPKGPYDSSDVNCLGEVSCSQKYLEHLHDSEAFALFFLYFFKKKISCATSSNTVEQCAYTVLINNLTDKKIHELRMLKAKSNPDVQVVVDSILIAQQCEYLRFEYKKKREIFGSVSDNFKFFNLNGYRELDPFIPEVLNLIKKGMQLKESASFYHELCQAYPDMLRSGRCDLAYEIFYESLTSTSKAYTRSLKPSYFLKGDQFPIPEEFQKLSLDHPRKEAALYIQDQERKEIRAFRVEQKATAKKRIARHRALISKQHREKQGAVIQLPQTKQDTVIPAAIAVTPFSLTKIQEPAATIAKPISLFERIVSESAYPVGALTYAPRVNLWFENPEAASRNAENQGMDQTYRDEWVMFHTLPKFLDLLIGTRYCIEGTCENRKGEKSALFSFVGEIIDATGKASRGILSIAVDRERVCWHRCWSKRTTSDLVNQITNGTLFKIDSPTPAEAAQQELCSKKIERVRIDNIPVTFRGIGRMSIPIGNHHTLSLFLCPD